MTSDDWIPNLNAEIISCRKCPRLVEWREKVALEKRASFANDDYWGKAVPMFGDFNADLLIVGLAPAAHGANRTGRMFTGDRSGDWLFRALFKAGLASQPASINIDDGLHLRGVLIAACCHCAPPDNKPTTEELATCTSSHLERILHARRWRGVLCLGGIAWVQVHRVLGERSPAFGHGAIHALAGGLRVVASYHPSQQNTFTGRLTEDMLDSAIQAWSQTPKID